MRTTHPTIRFLTAILLTLALFVYGHPVFAETASTVQTVYPDVPADAVWASAVDLLSRLGVIQGNSNGQFLPDTAVTREQFAKMAVTAANLATDKTTTRNATRFVDVPASRWSSGYIRTATANNMMVGYADGRFHPEATITWAQALTVCLRLVGIGDDALSGTWPNSVMDKAAALGWTAGFPITANTTLTRRDCAVLLARLLETETGDVPYAQSTGLYQSVVVLADGTVDNTLESDEIRTGAGILTNRTTTALSLGGEWLVHLDGTHVTSVFGAKTENQAYPVADLVDGTLYYKIGITTFSLLLKADMTLYDNSGPLTLQEAFTSIQAGSRVTLASDPADGRLVHLHFSRPATARYGSHEELLVLETAQTDDTLPANAIVTDKGRYTLATGVESPEPGTRVGAVANGTVLIGIDGQVNRTVKATVLRAVGTQLVQMRNGVSEAVSLSLDTIWYHDGTTVPAEQVPSLVSRCSSIVYGMHPDGNTISYAVLYDPLYSAPQIADQQEVYDMTLGDIDLDNVLLSRGGDMIAVYEIRNNDVGYEITDIWGKNRFVELYQGQYIGIIEAYTPNRFAPESMQLAIYNDDTGRYSSQVFVFSPEFEAEALSDGKYDVGDSVILLTGRDGGIVKLFP